MHHLLEQLASEPARRLVWGLMPRGIGLTFLVAYTSLWRQILPLLGTHGIDPVGLQLVRIREDFPLIARLRLHPSLLWLAHGDTALRIYVGAGILAACGMILGGPAAWPCALYCWAVWLSFHFSLRLNYPWDTVLLEAGFLCLFLPGTQLLPGLAANALPHPLLPFIFQLLVFRVLFGFGKTKFFGISRDDWNYTRYFLMNMPLCSRIGWRFSKLPDAVHKLTLAGIGFVELVSPILILFPGPARLVGGAAIVGQMIGIQLTGNFGYFNLLSTMLCVCTLDITSTLLTGLADPAALVTPERLPFTLVAVFITLAAPVYLIFNSWFTYGFLHWAAFERLPRGPLRGLLALLRFMEPLRIVNSYGVFRASPAPPVRWVTVVEGSCDGQNWQKYRYRFTQTDERSTPRFVAPHHPRLDHQTFYDAVGVDGTGYLHSVSLANPYLFTPSSVLDRTMQRLLEPGAPGTRLFAESPFPEGPPPLARVALYRFTSTTLEEHKQTGRYWNVMPVGLHLAPTPLNDDVWKRWMPPPELFHSEAPGWRRRARFCRGINQAQLSAFWDDFLPFVKATALAISPADPYSWQVLQPLQQALRKRYTRDEVRQFQLTLGRLAMVLMARLEAVFSRPAQHFMRDIAGFPRRKRPEIDPFAAPAGADVEQVWQALAAWPHGALRSRFHVGLAVQWIILEGGREAWQRVAGSDAAVAGTGAPIRTEAKLSRRARSTMAAAARELGLELQHVLDAARSLTIARGMFLEGVVNYDMVARQASRLRVLYSSDDGYTPPPTGLVPGVFELTEDLREQPSLCMMVGWGEETHSLPMVDPPHMVFGEDRVWRERTPHEAAGQVTRSVAG
ncbi:MAG: lipase maturation factor family protein [Acidobacteriia bacterium]|nr:lipase maturation factor family protein [Terriglobia bacterium]